MRTLLPPGGTRATLQRSRDAARAARSAASEKTWQLVPHIPRRWRRANVRTRRSPRALGTPVQQPGSTQVGCNCADRPRSPRPTPRALPPRALQRRGQRRNAGAQRGRRSASRAFAPARGSPHPPALRNASRPVLERHREGAVGLAIAAESRGARRRQSQHEVRLDARAPRCARAPRERRLMLRARSSERASSSTAASAWASCPPSAQFASRLVDPDNRMGRRGHRLRDVAALHLVAPQG